MSVRPSLDELRGWINTRLGRFLDGRRAALPEAGLLVEEIERLIVAGGKRLRPAFCYWGYRAAGGDHDERIVSAAAALELLHTFAIVHDDIMDDASQRRGQPAVHAVHGVDVALLVGDLALVLADEALLSSGFGSDLLLRAFDAYSRMRQEVIAGQYLDLVAASSPVISEDEARRIAVLKSGRYSVQEPLAVGAALAAAGPELLSGLAAYGTPLGEAFQLRDDLLGTFGTSSLTGKPVDSDIREGKRNLLFARTLAALQDEERAFFLEHWGGGPKLGEEDVERLRRLVVRTGARAQTESLLNQLVDEAKQALSQLRVDEETRLALTHLVREATARQA